MLIDFVVSETFCIFAVNLKIRIISCPICGRNNCCKSFHSSEEQNAYDEILDSVLPSIINSLKRNVDRLQGHYHGDNYYIRLEDVIKEIDDIS